MTKPTNDAFDSNRSIAYGVEQPGVYDGILYWVDTNGYAFHRHTENYMKQRAQPYIDTYNAGRDYTAILEECDKTDKSHKSDNQDETDK